MTVVDLRLKLFGTVELCGDGISVSSFGTVRAAKLLVLLGLARSVNWWLPRSFSVFPAARKSLTRSKVT